MFSKNQTKPGATQTINPERRQAKLEKRRRFWRKARKGLLCTLAIAFVAHLSLNIYASIQLNRELATIRQKGEPLRLSEMEPPAVPDAQNAALVYKQATKSLQFSPDEKTALRTRQNAMTPQIEKALESALRNNRKALALTRQAAAMPECKFPLDWKGDPTRIRFPHYAEARELARLLAADAKIKARAGDREAALDDVRAMFGMSHHLSREPFLIGFLVAQALDSVAYKALGEVLESTPLTVAQARALEAFFPKDDWSFALRRSLLGERTFSIFGFESLGQSAPPSDDGESDSSYMPVWTRYPLLGLARPVLKLDEIQTLRLWRRLLDSPESQQIPTPSGFGLNQDRAMENTPFYAVLTRILFPVFNRASTFRDMAEVRRRQRTVALALTCFRTANGHYPASLREAEALWGQSLPLDLYTQKPFVYKSDGKTFTLYSIGPNRADDGGKGLSSPPATRPPLADDIVWSSSSP